MRCRATPEQTDLVIHAGRWPSSSRDLSLHIVISTYSAVIWQFSGATERIERAVMSSVLTGPGGGQKRSGPWLVGATGVAPSGSAFS